MLGLTSLNLAMLLGSLITEAKSLITLTVGLAIHLVISATIAVIYAIFFEVFGRAGWSLGILFSVVHTIIGGLFYYGLPVLSDGPARTFGEPGFLLVNYGIVNVIYFIVIHLIYGVIVGMIYSRNFR